MGSVLYFPMKSIQTEGTQRRQRIPSASQNPRATVLILRGTEGIRGRERKTAANEHPNALRRVRRVIGTTYALMRPF